MTHRFEADSIILEFGTKRILSDIHFKSETGKITGILGRNGQGKTCLMNVVYGCLDALSKSVRFDNVSVAQAFKRPDLLTYLPQFSFIPAYLPVKRVFIDFALSLDEFINQFPEFNTMSNVSTRHLSGGQRRLIEVYAIIKTRSRFSMLDEPFSHLAPLHLEKIKEILQEEKRTKGFLVTDHLFQQVTGICDDLYVLKDGKMHLTKDKTDIATLGYARL